MFTSVLNSAVGSLTISNALLCIFTALILGLIIAFTYMLCTEYSKSFVVTLVLLPALVQIVIMMVNGNLGTGVAVLGAFSLVRFRSIPGRSMEIGSIFFAMAVGLAIGMGYITFAVAATMILCLAFFLLLKTNFGEKKDEEKELKVTIPENLDYTEVFNDIFERFTKKVSLERVKTTNLGSMYELKYNIVLKNISKEKTLIDEIRCRNGNLNIVCSRQQSSRDEP